MKLQIIPITLALATCSAWAATTYTYNGVNFTQVANHSTCDAPGPCSNYTTSMKVTGSFTTSSPLGANLATTDISSLITAYSFNDGINTISMTDSNSRIVSMQAATDSSAQLTDWNIVVELWQSASAHDYTSRLAAIALVNAAGSGGTSGSTYALCDGGDLVTATDTCSVIRIDTSASRSLSNTPGSWSTGSGGTTAVPALPKSGLLALGVLMGWMGLALIRRRLA